MHRLQQPLQGREGRLQDGANCSNVLLRLCYVQAISSDDCVRFKLGCSTARRCITRQISHPQRCVRCCRHPVCLTMRRRLAKSMDQDRLVFTNGPNPFRERLGRVPSINCTEFWCAFPGVNGFYFAESCEAIGCDDLNDAVWFDILLPAQWRRHRENKFQSHVLEAPRGIGSATRAFDSDQKTKQRPRTSPDGEFGLGGLFTLIMHDVLCSGQ